MRHPNTLSCIVPARNEAGHLNEVLDHVLSVPEITQVIIVEGGSSDNTWDVAETYSRRLPSKISLHKQEKSGKFDAVLTGAKYATGGHIVIWDADGTVPISDSRRVITSAMSSGQAAIGNRLLGKIEPGAMQFANYLGNWAFAIIWAPLFGFKPKDLLCGTKIFPRAVFTEMPQWLANLDPYGDFALISNSKSMGIDIESITVNYQARTYGETNIHRWRGGLQLLKTTVAIYIAFLKGKFNSNKS